MAAWKQRNTLRFCSRSNKKLNSILRCVQGIRFLQVKSIMAIELLYLLTDNSVFLKKYQPYNVQNQAEKSDVLNLELISGLPVGLCVVCS
jgi:hypothetical protein